MVRNDLLFLFVTILKKNKLTDHQLSHPMTTDDLFDPPPFLKTGQTLFPVRGVECTCQVPRVRSSLLVWSVAATVKWTGKVACSVWVMVDLQVFAQHKRINTVKHRELQHRKCSQLYDSFGFSSRGKTILLRHFSLSGLQPLFRGCGAMGREGWRVCWTFITTCRDLFRTLTQEAWEGPSRKCKTFLTPRCSSK